MYTPKNTGRRMQPQGFFGIGIQNSLSEQNLGTLWRSAVQFGAAYIFTIGKKYKMQNTDTVKSYKNLPLFQYEDFDEFINTMSKDCKLIGIEIDDKSQNIVEYEHFQRSIYLLGSEGQGLTKQAIDHCHDIIYAPSMGCLNVSVTGSIVMYDRIAKTSSK